MMEITPCDYYERFESLPVSVPLLPCRSFRRSYAALCDYFDQPFREEVVWVSSLFPYFFGWVSVTDCCRILYYVWSFLIFCLQLYLFDCKRIYSRISRKFMQTITCGFLGLRTSPTYCPGLTYLPCLFIFSSVKGGN